MKRTPSITYLKKHLNSNFIKEGSYFTLKVKSSSSDFDKLYIGIHEPYSDGCEDCQYLVHFGTEQSIPENQYGIDDIKDVIAIGNSIATKSNLTFSDLEKEVEAIKKARSLKTKKKLLSKENNVKHTMSNYIDQYVALIDGERYYVTTNKYNGKYTKFEVKDFNSYTKMFTNKAVLKKIEDLIESC